MKAPAGADLRKRECVLLSGGVPTEGEGLEFPPGQEAGALSPAGTLGFQCGSSDQSEAAVAACRPDTCLVYPYSPRGSASFPCPYTAMCYHRRWICCAVSLLTQCLTPGTAVVYVGEWHEGSSWMFSYQDKCLASNPV